jgi:hypothetical protein
MRITWARGFLRLWIVASLGWAACVGVELRPDAAWRALSLLSQQPGAKLDAGRLQNAGLQFRAANNVAPADNEAFIVAVQQADRGAANKTLAWFAWMVGVPSALVLLVGLGVRWVVRGFIDRTVRREPPPLRAFLQPDPATRAAGARSDGPFGWLRSSITRM